MAQVKSLKMGIKFKDTPVGKVPVDWEVTQLGNIVKVKRGALHRFLNAPKSFDELSKEVDREFLYYYLQRNDHKLDRRQGVQGNLSALTNYITYLLLPSFPEQKKIVEILSNVDDAIEETSRIIEKTKELHKGLMLELLTQGIGYNKYKETEIENEVKHKEKLEDLKKSLMQVLLTGKKRVKIT